MKKLLLVWNLLLTAVVAVLLYFHWHNASNPAIQEAPAMQWSDTAGLRIVYINIDSLENRYDLFTEKKKQMDDKQQQSQNQFDQKMTEFQNEYAAAQQSANTMTETQLAATEDNLKKKQAALQQLQDKLQNDIQQQMETFNQQIKDSLDSFLKDYEAKHPFTYVLSKVTGGAVLFAQPQLDITTEIVNGMNERLKKK